MLGMFHEAGAAIALSVLLLELLCDHERVLVGPLFQLHALTRQLSDVRLQIGCKNCRISKARQLPRTVHGHLTEECNGQVDEGNATSDQGAIGFKTREYLVIIEHGFANDCAVCSINVGYQKPDALVVVGEAVRTAAATTAVPAILVVGGGASGEATLSVHTLCAGACMATSAAGDAACAAGSVA